MTYLSLAIQNRIVERTLRSRRTFLLLDYDGTLAPIRPRPELAVLDDAARNLLERLSRDPRFSVAVISGRKLSDLKARVKLKNILYAGNHGLELEGPVFSVTHAKARSSRKVLQAVKAALEPLTKIFTGSFIEDKGLTLTYHHRLMPSALDGWMSKSISGNITPWTGNGGVRVHKGKKTLEVRPAVNWDKGSAVNWLLLREDPESYPIYIGDDRTDESAFKALKGRGVTVRVGRNRRSSARYFVKSPREVLDFLSCLAGPR